MKIQTLLMAIFFVAMTSLSVIGCRTLDTKTEKITTQVNPVTGTETVQKETTTTK